MMNNDGILETCKKMPNTDGDKRPTYESLRNTDGDGKPDI